MTFRHWLTGHAHDDTPLGDLARDVARDRDLPPELTQRQDWRRYLCEQHACDQALATLECAWDVYERGEPCGDDAAPARGPVERRKACPMPKPRPTAPLIFPWAACACACGRMVAVAYRDGLSWVPEAGERGTAHADVEPCAHCHCLMLRPGARTVVERPRRGTSSTSTAGPQQAPLVAERRP